MSVAISRMPGAAVDTAERAAPAIQAPLARPWQRQPFAWLVGSWTVILVVGAWAWL